MHSLPFCKRKAPTFLQSLGDLVRCEPTCLLSLSAPDLKTPRGACSPWLAPARKAWEAQRDRAPFPATYDDEKHQEDINISILLVLYLTKAAALSSDARRRRVTCNRHPATYFAPPNRRERFTQRQIGGRAIYLAITCTTAGGAGSAPPSGDAHARGAGGAPHLCSSASCTGCGGRSPCTGSHPAA